LRCNTKRIKHCAVLFDGADFGLASFSWHLSTLIRWWVLWMHRTSSTSRSNDRGHYPPVLNQLDIGQNYLELRFPQKFT
jgi:hypothetical protein